MRSDVFYLNARSLSEMGSLSKVKPQVLLGEIGFDARVKPGNSVCVKTHFGALANTRYLRPSYTRFLVDHVKQLGGVPYVAESCGAGMPHGDGEYAGRASEAEYLECAKRHGFTPDTMGCPVLMLDGPLGLDWFAQEIKGLFFDKVLVAGKLLDTDVLLVMTHFKGHGSAGFGGALKNIGIGCVAKGGKSDAHHGTRMDIKQESCPEGCTACIDVCPAGALTRSEDGYIIRDVGACKRCRFCHSTCKHKMFVGGGNISAEQFVSQVADNALGVVQAMGQANMFYVNYVIDVVPQCDCSGASDVPIVPDIGVLASKDPVALDQACVDLVHAAPVMPRSLASDLGLADGSEKFSFIYGKKGDPPVKTWDVQLAAAEKVGLGTRAYELVDLDE